MRVYLRRRSGFRGPRGGLVFAVQRSLNASGAASIGEDGIFGGETESGLKSWQTANGAEPTGHVDETAWQALVSAEPPSVFRRCLAVTAAFEGHGYTFAAGNWDNAYVTWGIVGFTLKHGNLGKVVKTVESERPGLIAATIGDEKADKLLTIIDAGDAEKEAWANSISSGASNPPKYRLVSDWTKAFEDLGNKAEVQAVQDRVAREVYWARGVQDLNEFGALTELDAALFFDTAVQNGGVNGPKAAAIRRALNDHPGAPTRERLRLIADAIAENSNPRFVEDVRSRRRAIALGDGEVHQARYMVADWAVDEVAVTAEDLQR